MILTALLPYLFPVSVFISFSGLIHGCSLAVWQSDVYPCYPNSIHAAISLRVLWCNIWYLNWIIMLRYIPWIMPGIILYMHPANKRWRYIVTSSFIGWVHIQNDPCIHTVHTLLCFDLVWHQSVSLKVPQWLHWYRGNPEEYWLNQTGIH